MARSDQEIIKLKQKVRTLEYQLNFILDHLQLIPPREPEPRVSPEILDLVRDGRKIEAIKLYREETGVGLKEAKDYIDSLMN